MSGRPVSVTEYCAIPQLDVPYLTNRLIPEDCRIALVGPAKTGKSFFALQIALAVAQGKPFIGRETKQANVLYLQFDTPDHIWRERLKDLEAAGIDIHNGSLFLPEPGTLERPYIMKDSNKFALINLMTALAPTGPA